VGDYLESSRVGWLWWVGAPPLQDYQAVLEDVPGKKGVLPFGIATERT